MKNHSLVPVPILFWIIAGLALVWNAIGVMAFVGHISMTAETLATLPELDQQLINATPQWVNIAFGAAVIFGLLGCLALLFRKKLAINLLLISMLAVLVQMTHMFFISGVFQLKGWSMAGMPVAVILIAIFLWRYAIRAKLRHWLN